MNLTEALKAALEAYTESRDKYSDPLAPETRNAAIEAGMLAILVSANIVPPFRQEEVRA